MMMDKRLINAAGKSKKYIYICVLFQWIGLAANVCMVFALANLLGKLYEGDTSSAIITTCITGAIGIPMRFFCGIIAGKMSEKASRDVKIRLREMIYQKLLRLGMSYQKHISTAEAIQLSGEGLEQLEIYFGRYLPQFFYSMLAPVTLFILLAFISLKSAVILLICVPLIPMSIIFVQKFAKKLFQKYWNEYVALGDGFLENMQGLTTLKIYRADERRNQEMNEQAERFRKITMKVLTMQLNSITLMDLVAYGGAALGAIIALLELAAGNISLTGCVTIILLAAEFFIPLRLLGSYFHIAMNGMAASGKMWRLLDVPEAQIKTTEITGAGISLENLSFSYDKTREILHGISMTFPTHGMTAIVGESGSGKSTIASLLTGTNTSYSGSLLIGGQELSEIREDNLLRHIALIGHQSRLFAGTVRDNLRMGNPNASDSKMKSVLEQVKLWDYLKGESGLDTVLTEDAANFSGGQKQRLALARILLYDSEVLIFDEATSNIDVESETDIMALVGTLAETKTIIVISHRLANVIQADGIYVLENGCVAESGTHNTLLHMNGQYARLWREQQELEQIRDGKENMAI
ncbi:MAG: ABC transporter ATP-binding protein/permease [Clostridiales bacterium]|jgi:ATP-binding cassette subfamily C protein|nr:ABC transporter ATP-binding protein/permease [Clostridiales bacterium]